MTGLLGYALLKATPEIRTTYEACVAECPDANVQKPSPIGMIDYYVAHVNFGNMEREHQRKFVTIKTNFSLPKKQVDGLIEEGRRQIKNDPQILKLLQDLTG